MSAIVERRSSARELFTSAWATVRRRAWPHIRLSTLITVAYFIVVFTMLLAPLVVVIGGSFSAPESDKVVMSYVQFPPERLTLEWYRESLRSS